ncbi:PhnB protein [Actinoplanes tereljensis]|uniref:VOC family protein n=1 Tax=Paractinoplanes tereljensis TaxID=571912 RepID=A0A919NPA6_9ACTN|nr:VOC family protein [Actinoplanes tereljensis]GIF22569.1 VOC family protein [Actinoplanes tereljensis]
MASQLNPYLTFDGNARQAMEFYQSVLGGELKVSTFGEFGNPDPAVADLVMHANLLSPQGYHLMASDTAPGMTLNPGNNITVSLSGDPGEGLEAIWDKLAEGGEVHVPFEKQMWGDIFGQVKDKFGIQWMVDVLGS